ncbi:MAG: penicillin-binding protein 2 [Thalassolituus sp.]|jgi:cell division protein FtsI (penicillin-binding protein 3)|uniref:Peptidoglycan D,D-transpeptidase FtsI n=2 Tax=root TaxID=1 RepID=M5E0H4_9GAMM|nr:penicillin-binding protein 2 [Thalassolituus oleivorans]AHK16540.1 cell division protein [Thalassolituus oleivorans R6-15]APR67968.1 cell division protein [Thalassolituus oleivorans]MBQ0726406.1 penicillin-binding protein 2 [Thalassolituus oleivorans]MBQ0779538.1 penicillin-binding protein 2 [Thalassolituus oleivorans]MCA6129355.1 cell division protein [Thalassolituus oleivorans 4BN06-13]
MTETSLEPQENSIVRWRFTLVLAVFALLLAVVLGRLVILHTVDQPFLFEQGEKRTVREEVQPASRGMITDRFGTPLAVSTPVVTLWLNPQQVNIQQLPAIAKDLDIPAHTLVKSVERAASQGRSFIYLKRQVEPDVAEKVLARRVAGVYGDEDFRRFYPAAEITAHTVGIVNIDGKGQEGLELAFDDYLRGHDGERKVVKDLYGNVIKQLEVNGVAENGPDMALTIDLRLQYLAYRELKAAVQQHRAKSGSAVIVDAHTGEVLALVSQPSYNPNNRATLKPEDMRNRAIADLIEPGSTMKPFTVAAALNSGRFFPSTQIDTSPGYVRVKNKTIRDHRDYGVLDITGIITKSSNVGVTYLAHKLGAEVIWDFFTKAGIGQPGVLGFPGEAVGVLPYPEQLDSLRLATASFGYGLAVSPLQLAQSYTAFAGGCRQSVRLIMRDEDKPACEPVMSAKVSRQILDMLETVTSDKGTGSRARVEGYRVGGKTGTAHKVGRGGYEDSAYTAVFAGIAPISDPDLVLVVVIDEPQGQEYYGGEVAAPVFSRIMGQALRLRQVAPDIPSKNTLQMAGGGA